jgi:hypothetical protein
MLREVAEMMYQWEVPFIVDDTRFRSTFGVAATPVETQVAETAAWARRHYGLDATARGGRQAANDDRVAIR